MNPGVRPVRERWWCAGGRRLSARELWLCSGVNDERLRLFWDVYDVVHSGGVVCCCAGVSAGRLGEHVRAARTFVGGRHTLASEAISPARCYLVDPASCICLSQRISHARLGMNRRPR